MASFAETIARILGRIRPDHLLRPDVVSTHPCRNTILASHFHSSQVGRQYGVPGLTVLRSQIGGRCRESEN